MAAYTTIDDPEAYFQTQLYTGTGSSLAVTLDGDTDMQPDFVWAKNRGQAEGHQLFDAVRGATKFMKTNNTDAEGTGAETLKSFDSDGFTVGTDADMNTSSELNVAWCWKESATSGFDIVTYTGNETNRTISHSLSAVPEFIVCKTRDSINDWFVYHNGAASDAETDYFKWDTNEATNDHETIWNDTAPTSSVFSVGTATGSNKSSGTMVAYLFAPKQGFSKMGSYEGNGNADGTFVYTGFRPAWVMTKSVDSTSAWEIFDNKREGYNVDNDALLVNASTVEATADQIDLLSNGFKSRIATDPNVAETYMYVAFAEAPFVNSNGVPCNAR